MKALEKQACNDEQQDRDDKKIKFATGLAPNRFAEIDLFRALDSFWRQFKSPCKNKRDRKSEREQHDDEANRPVRNLKKWKDLRRDLQQKPGDDCVGDRNLVNIASLQLCEEVVLQVHSAHLERSARPDCILPLSACLEKHLHARILYPLVLSTRGIISAYFERYVRSRNFPDLPSVERVGWSRDKVRKSARGLPHSSVLPS